MVMTGNHHEEIISTKDKKPSTAEFKKQLADKGLSEKEIEVVLNRRNGIIKDDETDIYLSLVKRYDPSDPWPDTNLFIEKVLNLTIPLPEKAPITTTSNEQQKNEQQANEQSKRDKRINDFIEDFLQDHNVIAMPNSHDLYIYDDASGIWRNGEDILFKETANQLSDSLTKNSLSDILLRIQGKSLIDDDKFNRQRKIGLLNGALDLETGEIIEPRPEFYITKQIPVKYDPNASPDKILKFIWDIAKPSAKKFLRLLEIAAWPLLSGYPIQKAVVLIGDGYNGKSTFLSLIRKFYGDKNVSTLTLQDLSKDFLKAELYNKLANISPDLPSSSISDTGDFKWATGGSDVKTAQRKYKTSISFLNEAKMYFSANQMPKVSEDTKAFYRRFDFIELENDFSQSDDPNLLNKITTEDQLSGLLNFVLKIFWSVLRKNLKFSFSDSIEETAKKYALNSNTPKLFFETCINYDDTSDDWIGATDLYNTYIEWCEKNGLIKVSQTAFGREMKYSIQRTGRRDGRMVYLGITLKDLDIPVNPKGNKENEGDVAEVIKNYLQVNELDTQFTQFTQFFPYCYLHGQEEEKEEKEREMSKQIGKNPVNPVNPVNDASILTENDSKVLKSIVSIVNSDSIVNPKDGVTDAIGQPLKTSKIEFVKPMEAFIWKDGEHGPFEPPQRVEINAEIADILIRAGRAIPCETADIKDIPREVS